MSGIIVGIDGSSHSQVALEWAMREAVIRRVPLTVITVEQVAASGWHGLVMFPADEHFLVEARKAALELVEKVTQEPDESAPPVTIQAIFGLPGRDADRGLAGCGPARRRLAGDRWVRPADDGFSQQPGRSSRALPRGRRPG